jgi:hypothetical protein
MKDKEHYTIRHLSQNIATNGLCAKTATPAFLPEKVYLY